ncbi:PAS domain S-box-containing protein/diguanylate cyclase (GGDEF) domain-containing protein [Sulfurivirga caldicuralii]|uniref:cyclic-guanylate-specific phosphodiesterase n=1 Tax=Sulfurivirga caldicuralii TaxID=364032 RepID=A0A1N6GWE8_9GAMM|nr:GGDEF domain-containing phosphodiesterase [Sulfurivirga caldicuralii]SIO11911.1 PAS domain S-box-containing protein/diguanylate cyclase (GGDEF) domain-containing protein [Sulfurivirga caldicuralii]
MKTPMKKYQRLVYAMLVLFFVGTVLFNVFWQRWAGMHVSDYHFSWGQLALVVAVALAIVVWLTALYRRTLRMERDLALENAHLTALAQSVPLALVEVDRAGHVVRFNGAAEQLFDVISENVCGQTIDAIADFELDEESQGGVLQALGVNFDQPGQQVCARLEAVLKSGREVKLDVDVTVVEVPATQGEGTRPLALVVFRDVTEEEKTRKHIMHLAYYDQLTHLLNRNGLFERVRRLASQIKENDALALILIDVRRFRETNDFLGQEGGDELLKIIAQRLRGTVRSRNVNLLARTGPNEFAILLWLPRIAGEHDRQISLVERICQRVHERLKQPYEIEGKCEQISVNFSMGASLENGGAAIEQLHRQADLALAAAKRDEENLCHFFDESMETRLMRTKLIEHALHEALAQNQFFLVYQPQFSAQTGALVGCEALIRWIHPEEGFIPPDEFISVAEHVGLISAIGEWVIDESIRQLVRWREMPVLKNIRIAINLSSVQLEDKTLLDRLQRKLKQAGVAPDLLELELTERVVMTDAAENVSRFQAIRAHGFDLAVDDFGTGYSSLAYLQKFPLSVLKVDKQFVDPIPDDEGACAIANAIVSLAHSLDMKVVAEGVETGEQVHWLYRAGYDLLQGYYLGRPMKAEDFQQWALTDYPVIVAKVWGHPS